MRRSALAILSSALILAGCATRPAAPPPPDRPAPFPSPSRPAPAAPNAAAYVEAAGSADLFVVRASELALQRLAAGAERRLAETMIREHRGMSAQLSLSGRRINLLPPASLLPRHETRLVALAASADFAAAYRRQLRTVHEELARLHSSFAERGSSPTLRPVAAAAAQRVAQHLGQMR